MTQPKPKITGLIITLNEEKNISEVIENIDFVDEIIVLDSFSTDKTVDIAQSYKHVKVYQNKFENFTDQRNLALDYANHNWILFLDADERLTSELRKEILETVKNEDTAEAYYFFRKFMFKDKPLHFSGWQTDKNIRLFKKDAARYSKERLVHEILRVKGRTRTMKHKLIHYSYIDYDSYKQKMINYANLKAKELYMKDVKPNFFHYYIKPAYKFLYTFLIRLGILDGKRGFIICYLNALSVYYRYPFLKKLYQSKKEPI
ncbi:glycosyltransferase family 2 protein [Mesohalobacter halotolerans]|uniref:Glycosyltransferase family 2 protein n=1 Tax=Mesohalobacter halotolerans TaxID=1883405 RepID=A0A4U5TQZ9_9FLAO|nr:glycosyltransferase family 2 protein [Mesohalobacter halotolerans]MBS3739554.1 glycosyltransferase family 2 protein [Psychroflexus sp.]TKS56650.1 glycosyltransferase family 2 protein [Mesohalobacter halotolerans]